MIIDVSQWIEIKKSAMEAIETLTTYNMDNIEFGAMFEVPSAFLQAEEIFRLIDFGSVGSNDLIQYLFATGFHPGSPGARESVEIVKFNSSIIGKTGFYLRGNCRTGRIHDAFTEQRHISIKCLTPFNSPGAKRNGPVYRNSCVDEVQLI
jgi:hypothetical protein